MKPSLAEARRKQKQEAEEIFPQNENLHQNVTALSDVKFFDMLPRNDYSPNAPPVGQWNNFLRVNGWL